MQEGIGDRRSSAPDTGPTTVTSRSSRLRHNEARSNSARGGLRRIKPGDIAAEVEVLLRPGADFRQAGTERAGDDVIWVADKDRSVTDTRVASDMLDHLGIVVRGQIGLAVAALRHRHVADEIGEPGERFSPVCSCQMVDFPHSSAMTVIRTVFDDLLEQHEIGDQNLVIRARAGDVDRAAGLALI